MPFPRLISDEAQQRPIRWPNRRSDSDSGRRSRAETRGRRSDHQPWCPLLSFVASQVPPCTSSPLRSIPLRPHLRACSTGCGSGLQAKHYSILTGLSYLNRHLGKDPVPTVPGCPSLDDPAASMALLWVRRPYADASADIASRRAPIRRSACFRSWVAWRLSQYCGV